MNEIKANSWVKYVGVEGVAVSPKFKLEVGKYYYCDEIFSGCKGIWVDEYTHGIYECAKFVPASYEEAQQASGLKVGDKVRLLRAPSHHEKGWKLESLKSFNAYVGKIGTIIEVEGENGFLIDFKGCPHNCYLPFFVLEKVEQKENKMRTTYCKVNNKYEAEALQLIAEENERLVLAPVSSYLGNNGINSYVENKIFELYLNTYCFIFAAQKKDSDEVSFPQMIKLLGEYGKKKLPDPMEVGKYTTEWVTNMSEDKILEVKVGCQTISVETITAVYQTIQKFNED
jgi:hypothetical protein